ncbi:hypothetical protein NQZ68_012582 [Dissostichus eleginoides]|nr:hypothetical protein NQZ68_012582 [Dissostichus eleginoides]
MYISDKPAQLCLPGAESGQHDPEHSRRVVEMVMLLMLKTICPPVRSPRQARAVEPYRKNKQSLTEPDTKVYSVGL